MKPYYHFVICNLGKGVALARRAPFTRWGPKMGTYFWLDPQRKGGQSGDGSGMFCGLCAYMPILTMPFEVWK